MVNCCLRVSTSIRVGITLCSVIRSAHILAFVGFGFAVLKIARMPVYPRVSNCRRTDQTRYF